MYKKFSFVFLALLFVSCGYKKIILSEDGNTKYVIYYGSQEGPVVKFAAKQLSSYLGKISGAPFILTTDENAGDKLIVVGKNNPFTSAHSSEMPFDSIKADGFWIKNIGDTIYITGSIDRGTLYGVYHFLDMYLGVKWLSPDFEVIPTKKKIVLSTLNDLENPRFIYREIFNADTDDPYYRQRNRLNGSRFHRLDFQYPECINTWSKFVPSGPPPKHGGHNFYTVVPSERYHYGRQLLAMDEGCRSAAVNYFLKTIKNYGTDLWYGFTQMDNGWEPDSASQAFADAHGGALSAPVLDMVIDVANRVRKTYSDAKFATYAYQFSFHPPSNLAIPDYILVEPAPIHADFGKPYDAPANSEIDRDLKGWAKIAKNLGVWTYIANFQNYLQPLPNIFAMCEDIKYLAKMTPYKEYFGQSSYNTKGGEFAELRAWVAARLLWNPDQDYHKLINEFIDYYYGPAACYIKKYINALHKSLQITGDRIAVKQSITSKYLNLDFIMKADKLMALADSVAKGEYAKHVHKVRLGVDMTILLLEHLYQAEAEKRNLTWHYDPERRSRFEKYVAEANITQYNEDSSIEALFEAMNIKRVNPSTPDVAKGLADGDWVDYQDLDFEICCGADIVADSSASDNGAVKKRSDDVWAIQMDLGSLPTQGKWTLYAYVRIDPKKGANPSETAFNMGIWPGKEKSVKLAEVQDGKYHVFKFPDIASYQIGRDIWFSGGPGSNYLYVDRIVAVKVSDVK